MCETCKQHKDILYEENGLYFCSIVCFALYIQVTKKWTEPLIPLKEGVDPCKRVKTVH